MKEKGRFNGSRRGTTKEKRYNRRTMGYNDRGMMNINEGKIEGKLSIKEDKLVSRIRHK